MRAFADLFAELEDAAEPDDKVSALARYFSAAAPEDAAWAVVLMAGQGPKRTLTPRRLRQWASQATGIPDWLFTACRQAVSDLAETAALLQSGDGSPGYLRIWIEERLLPLTDLEPAECRRRVLDAWGELDERQAVVWNQLLIGSFKPPITRRQLVRALADSSDASIAVIDRRLDADLKPTADAYRALLAPAAENEPDKADESELLSLDTVLIYAQRGRGRRAAFYSDLTLGLWQEGALVPFARTDRGLDDQDLARVDAFVRRHVVDRFGPVRAVEPRLVFTVAFEGLEAAPRRKSGLKVRGPRLAGWREDAQPEDADSLSAAQALLDKG